MASHHTNVFYEKDLNILMLILQVTFLVVHVLVVMIIGILLLNFLVAFTTARATNMSAYRDNIVILNQLLASVIIESRLRRIIPSYFDMFRKKRMLVTTDGKVYLLTMKRVQSNHYCGQSLHV